MEVDDGEAMSNMGEIYYNGAYDLGCHYLRGDGLSQDYNKALELWNRAAELGHAHAYHNIGTAYYFGRGVKADKKKALHYFELAAMNGVVLSRHNVGTIEWNEGNTERAIKHYMIAVDGGCNDALKKIQELYSKGLATKDDYAKALRSYQDYLGEVRSNQRDEAAKFSEKFKYIE